MLGAILLIVGLVIVLPVLIIMSGVVLAAGLGHLLRHDGERRHEGSELVELYR